MARKRENIQRRKDGYREARIIICSDSAQKNLNKFIYAHTYAEFLDFWIGRKRLGLKESSYIRYKNIVETHIKPVLGQYPIAEISTQLMEQYVNQKFRNGRLDGNGGLSTKSVQDILTVIKESFKYAQLQGATTQCDFDQIHIKNFCHQMQVLSHREEQLLLTTLYHDMDRYKLGIFISLYTGIRIGELCALQWKNISLSEKTIRIEHSMQRLQYDSQESRPKTRIVIMEPKSNAAYRTIPLPGFIVDVLKPFAGSPTEYVLSGKTNQFVEPRTMQNHFKYILLEGNIKRVRFHTLRHTFATRCVESGFDIKTLSEILGHTNVKITLEKYVHSSMELKRHNMEKLRPPII